MEYFKYVGVSKRWPWERSKIGGKVHLCARGKKNVKNLTLDEACRAYAEVTETLLALYPSECSGRFISSRARLRNSLKVSILLLDPIGFRYEFKDGNFFPGTPWLRTLLRNGRWSKFKDGFGSGDFFPETPELRALLRTGQLPGFNDSFEEGKRIRKAFESLFNIKDCEKEDEMEYFKYVGVSKRWPWERSRMGGKVHLCARGKKNVKNLTLDETCRAYAEVTEILLALDILECSGRLLRSHSRLMHGLELRILLLDPNGYGPKTPELRVLLETGQLPGFNDSFEKGKRIREAFNSLFNK